MASLRLFPGRSRIMRLAPHLVPHSGVLSQPANFGLSLPFARHDPRLLTAAASVHNSPEIKPPIDAQGNYSGPLPFRWELDPRNPQAMLFNTFPQLSTLTIPRALGYLVVGLFIVSVPGLVWMFFDEERDPSVRFPSSDPQLGSALY